MAFSPTVRKLSQNGQSVPIGSVHSKNVAQKSGTPLSADSFIQIKGMSGNKEEPVNSQPDANLDESSINVTTSAVAKDHLESILEQFLPTDLFNDSGNNSTTSGKNQVILNQIYRDMYYHDPVCGSAVDIMSNMPFSDFVLNGVKDRKILNKYYDSLNNIRVKSLLPSLSVDYLVHGLFLGTLIYDSSGKKFTGIVPQNIDNVEVQPIPIFGRDPLISLNVGDALKALNALSGDDTRLAPYRAILESNKSKGSSNTGNSRKTTTLFTPDADDVIYIPRRGMLRDVRGVSIYRRLLTAFLYEKSIYRGTLDQASKRQRAIVHIVVGEPEWTPTAADMSIIADSYMSAAQDPVGAVFVTRSGVSANELGAADSFWKINDVSDFFTSIKYKALGISESFIDGTAGFNSLEQVMTTFVENMRNYRENITQEVFYDRLFPKISKDNAYTRKKYGSVGNSKVDVAGVEDFNYSEEDENHSMYRYMEQAGKLSLKESDDYNDLLIPQVVYLKRLRPEADQQYFEMLNLLQEKGIPVPLRVLAAAAGQDLDGYIDGMEEDLALRTKMKEFKARIKEIDPAMGAGPQEGGGEEGGDGGEFSLSSLNLNTDEIDRVLGSNVRLGLGNRDYSDVEDLDKYNTLNSRRYKLSTQGRALMQEKLNKAIAESAAELAKKENYFEKIKQKEIVENSDVKYFIPK
jgi:hypothetical protein